MPVTVRQPNIERPGCVTDEHLACLDTLRESGGWRSVFGSRRHFTAAFPDVPKAEASEVLKFWIKTREQFGPESS